MPILNVQCPICTDYFKNSDDIYTTSCGHIFHYVCMRDWQSRATSCPQCRTYNPTTHKLYLSFDDSDENPTAINELKVQLQTSAETIQKLNDQIREGDTNFLHLQEQYTTSERLIRELENQVLHSNESETNFLRLQGQYTETEDLSKELQDEIQILKIEIECKTKELALKTLQIATLKTSLEATASQTSEVILNDKIKILEQKLKHLSTEFEKEITNSTQLSIDKMKLQSYIDRMKLETNNSNVTVKPEFANNSLLNQENNRPRNNSKTSSFKERNQKRLASKAALSNVNPLNQTKDKNLLNSTESLNSISSSYRQIDSSSGDNITSVVIKDYPLNQISYPLENIIIVLASKMDLNISKEDISKVNIMERNKQRQLPKKVTLFVQLKTMDLKLQFLSNKNRLRNNPTTESLTIKEYIDDLTYSVFVYANKKLRGNGFQYIFCKNNQVIAKKHRNDSREIRIYSRNQVDDLLKKANTPPTFEPIVLNLYEDKVDESFYKI